MENTHLKALLELQNQVAVLVCFARSSVAAMTTQQRHKTADTFRVLVDDWLSVEDAVPEAAANRSAAELLAHDLREALEHQDQEPKGDDA